MRYRFEYCIMPWPPGRINYIGGRLRPLKDRPKPCDCFSARLSAAVVLSRISFTSSACRSRRDFFFFRFLSPFVDFFLFFVGFDFARCISCGCTGYNNTCDGHVNIRLESRARTPGTANTRCTHPACAQSKLKRQHSLKRASDST